MQFFRFREGGRWWVRNFQIRRNPAYPDCFNSAKYQSNNPLSLCVHLALNLCCHNRAHDAAFAHLFFAHCQCVDVVISILRDELHIYRMIWGHRSFENNTMTASPEETPFHLIHYPSNIINYVFTHGYGSTTAPAAARAGGASACEYHNYCTHLMIIALDSV